MSPWKEHLIDFYEHKIHCGYKYEKGLIVISLFDRYYSSLNIDDLVFSRDIVEPFLYLDSNERIGTQISMASVLRQFGKYLFSHNVIENIYIIPSISRKGEAEYIPYIYSKKELTGIVNYLENYPESDFLGKYKLLPNTINAVTICIKILITTGMRLGEVLNLRTDNINFNNNIIYIDIAKNDNKRMIPISQTLTDEIRNYIVNTPFVLDNHEHLLYIDVDNRLKESNVHYYFYKALKHNKIKRKKHGSPRIHDFRHTFAVMSLTQLQKNDGNINLSLSYLSAYLGHKSLHETQKYVWLTPILFEETKNKMADYSSFITDIFGGDKFDED